MRAWTLALALGLSSAAWAAPEAAECPWGPRPRVSATMTSVTVDGESYGLVGLENRDRFAQLLSICDVPQETREAFEQWRSSRVGFNVTAVVGIAITPVWIGTLAFGVNAGNRRIQFVEGLITGEP